MLSPVYERSFKKGYKQAIKRGRDMTEIEAVMEMLLKEQVLPAKYKDHQLGGNWIGCRECHIRPDWLLIYKKTKTQIIFVDTGAHPDLFG
jgi:mRNA interferase YafQ